MLYFYNARAPGDSRFFASLGDTVVKPKQPPRDLSPTGEVRGIRLLADIAAGLASLEDPGTLQKEALKGALDLFRCASGAVCLCDGNLDRMRLGLAAGAAKGFRPEELLGVGLVRRIVLGERRPLVLEDPGLTLGSEMGGWRGLAVAPIAGPQRLLGMLVLGDLADGDAFTPTDVALMAALGNIVAVAAETSLVHAEFRQQMERSLSEVGAELAHASAELQRVKTINEELFQSVPIGIVVFDRQFRVTIRNAAGERLWADDRSVLDAARRTDVARYDPEWESGLRDVVNMRRPWLAEDVVLERPGREGVRLNLSCSPLLSGRREVVGGVLIVEDVTQRVRMERRLVASERLAGVGRLAAMVAHEINNPLDGIIRLVNLAGRAGGEGDAPRVERYLADAGKGLQRMVTIVRDLLDFSRSAGGAVEPMPIRDILAEASQAMAPAAEKGGVEMHVACDPELPTLRSGSLYHVVLNLVKNAVEATPSGGRVRVAVRSEADALLIEVTDTGPGIPPEVLPRLFEPFYSLKAIGKGTGLGLVISKDLVEKQGGTLTAANRPEGGAVFTVRIPFAAV